MSVLPIVDGAINTDGPHTGRVTVAIAIVLLTTVARGPHVNVAQSSSTLRKQKRTLIRSNTYIPAENNFKNICNTNYTVIT